MISGGSGETEIETKYRKENERLKTWIGVLQDWAVCDFNDSLLGLLNKIEAGETFVPENYQLTRPKVEELCKGDCGCTMCANAKKLYPKQGKE